MFNMLISISILLLLLFFSIFYENEPFKLAYTEAGYTIEELAQSLGLELEIHNLTTSDNYILQMHRIRCKLNEKQVQMNISTTCLPIYLQHGLLESSIAFLLIGHKSIAYLLAHNGYDVWLGNARGNFYSRKHILLDPDLEAKQFYNFSLHEIATIDLANAIDYILKITKQSKLFYLGHSQGAILFHILMSEFPEYNHKVQLMIALAPVVYTAGVRSPGFTITARFQHFLESASEIIGLYEMFPRRLFWRKFANSFCYDGAWTQQFCHLHLSIIGGFNDPQFNKTLLPLILSHVPAGASVKQIFQYAQILNSDILHQYVSGREFGFLENKELSYSLQSTFSPVAIFYGNNDYITSERNIDLLISQLPNVVFKLRMPDPFFNHFDFIFANNAIDILYPKIFDLLKEYHY